MEHIIETLPVIIDEYENDEATDGIGDIIMAKGRKYQVICIVENRDNLKTVHYVEEID
jgi:hypothetical protein